jgi:hypothetical protein
MWFLLGRMTKVNFTIAIFIPHLHAAIRHLAGNFIPNINGFK